MVLSSQPYPSFPLHRTRPSFDSNSYTIGASSVSPQRLHARAHSSTSTHYKSPSLGNIPVPQSSQSISSNDPTFPTVRLRKRTNTLSAAPSLDSVHASHSGNSVTSGTMLPKEDTVKRRAIYTQSVYIPSTSTNISLNNIYNLGSSPSRDGDFDPISNWSGSSDMLHQDNVFLFIFNRDFAN